MTEPIDIPGADAGANFQIQVVVRTPNGTTDVVTLDSSVNHPATIGTLQLYIEQLYPAYFLPEFDPVTNPLRVYTSDWVPLDDEHMELTDGAEYGICPSEADNGAAQYDAEDGEPMMFQMD